MTPYVFVMALVRFSVGKNSVSYNESATAALLLLGEAEELILSYRLHAENCPDTGLRQNRIN